MKILILNCDYDLDPETNGAQLIKDYLESLYINVEVLNCFDDEFPDELDYNGIVVTGSRASVYENLSWIEELKNTIREIDEKATPTLGICFGFQAVVDAFGGVVKSSGSYEEGFKKVNFNDHWLFESLQKELLVYESHGDIALELPKNAVVLSKNWCCESFQFRNFFCVQFHPEITREVAELMAERDGKDIDIISKDIPEEYNLPLQVIKNFVEYCRKADIFI